MLARQLARPVLQPHVAPPAAAHLEEPGAAVRRASELRGFCRRIFGWDDAQREVVDEVTCALLAAVAAGAAIALRGESDLVPVARALHRRLLGPERPFVICDPRRRDGDGSVRSAPNRRRGTDALVAAIGGSVCLRARRLPADFDEMADALRGFGPQRRCSCACPATTACASGTY